MITWMGVRKIGKKRFFENKTTTTKTTKIGEIFLLVVMVQTNNPMNQYRSRLFFIIMAIY